MKADVLAASDPEQIKAAGQFIKVAVPISQPHVLKKKKVLGHSS